MNKITNGFFTQNNQLSFDHALINEPLNSEFNVHIHNRYELYYFISGDVTYYIEGKDYKVKSGELIIINNKELHRPYFNSKAPYERMVIHFKPEYISIFNNNTYDLLYCFENRKLGHHNKIDTSEILEHEINKYFKKIEHYFIEKLPESETMILTIFIQLLVELNKIYSNKKNVLIDLGHNDNDTKLQSILHYINSNLSSKITLDVLQNEFYINKYHLCHIFKNSTGFTIQEYITYKRIIKACDLLSSGMPVVQVSSAVGFNDYSSFYRVFKKLLGISPKNFLK